MDAEGLARREKPLDLPGVDSLGERVYRAVLAERRIAARDIAGLLEVDEPTAHDRLEALRSAGLVTRLESAYAEYSAVDPRFAVRALA